MEADSTTLDNSSKENNNEPKLPFSSLPGNLLLYKDLTNDNGEKGLESQIVARLQTFGLIPKNIKCPTGQQTCKLVMKVARVIDKIQWVCDGCKKRLPIRSGSFFLRLQCSILQALQIILAWCEDAEYESVAQHFDVKPKVTNQIYERLDELAIKEQNKCQLGGEGSVVLTEMYPDCLNRLSPDTTDQPHVHRVLMMADTKHVPTRYHLHVIKDDLKKKSSIDGQSLKAEVEEVIAQKAAAGSMVVLGANVPPIEGAVPLQQLLQHCDTDMQHFLTSRIWRQAITVCAAARDVCAGGEVPAAATALCTTAVQRYLLTALHRLRHDDHFYRHTLTVLAAEYTDKHNESTHTC